MGGATDDLATLWRWFGEHQYRGYSPLYERVAESVAEDPEVLELLRQAPPEAHLPGAALAGVRYLLLDGLDHPLGEVYAGQSDADPGPLFLDVCRTQRADLLALLATRRVQTNDCGRCALIGPALTWVAEQLPGPYGLVDVGASAGLNLLGDRYRLDYGRHGATGPPDSTVQIACEVTGGAPPVAEHWLALESRIGIDRSPIDLAEPADARWLLACVWPDTSRAERVEASIALAQQDPPTVLPGQADTVLPGVLAGLPEDTTAVVTTTWAFGYFSEADRAAFVDLLLAESARRPIAWISAEGPGTVAALGQGDPAGPEVMGAVLMDQGGSAAQVLAHVHEHGNWIDWRA